MRIGINLLFLVAGKGGGIERFTRGLIAGLQKIDQRNEYFLFTNRDCRGMISLSGNFHEVAACVSGTFRPAKILWEQTALPLFLLRKHIDVLLSPGNIAPVLHSCPSVAVIHDVIPFLRPEIFATLERAALIALFRATAAYSSAVITVSQASKKDIVRIFNIDEDKVEVVYAGCEERFRPVKVTGACWRELGNYGINTRYILYVASSRAYKNIDGLMKAYKILRDRYAVTQSLVISGLAGRALPALEKLARNLNLGRAVIFSGYVPDASLPLLYSAADLFVYPSLYEGFGLPVVEAMACGAPVAASDVSAVPEAVGGAGLLFNPSNPEEMAEVMYRILRDPQLGHDLVKKGLARAGALSWRTAAGQVLAMLEKLHLGRTS